MFDFLVCNNAQRVSATTSETVHQFKFDNCFWMLRGLPQVSAPFRLAGIDYYLDS